VAGRDAGKGVNDWKGGNWGRGAFLKKYHR